MTQAQVTADIVSAFLGQPVQTQVTADIVSFFGQPMPVQLAPAMDYTIEVVEAPERLCPDCGDELEESEPELCTTCVADRSDEKDTVLRMAADMLRDGSWRD